MFYVQTQFAASTHVNFTDPTVHVNLKIYKGFQLEITNEAPPTRWHHATSIPAGVQSRVWSLVEETSPNWQHEVRPAYVQHSALAVGLFSLFPFGRRIAVVSKPALTFNIGPYTSANLQVQVGIDSGCGFKSS